MKKDKKISDFFARFIKIVSELGDLGDRLKEKEFFQSSFGQCHNSMTLLTFLLINL